MKLYDALYITTQQNGMLCRSTCREASNDKSFFCESTHEVQVERILGFSSKELEYTFQRNVVEPSFTSSMLYCDMCGLTMTARECEYMTYPTSPPWFNLCSALRSCIPQLRIKNKISNSARRNRRINDLFKSILQNVIVNG